MCGTASAADQGGQGTTLTKPLRVAAMDGDIEQIKLHIAKGSDVNKADERGTAPISYAAEFGGAEAVQLLLKAGAKVNVKAADGRTPLISASLQGKKDVVDVLLAAGADVKAKDLAQMTAMHVAAQFGHLDVIESLVKAGGDVNAQDAQMQTPLTIAERRQQTDIVEFLKQNGAKEPVLNMGRGPYGDYASEQGGPQGPVAPSTKVEVKIDPNVIREQVKGFEGLAEGIKAVDAKSEVEQKGWVLRRNDNRVTLVRTAEKQFSDELTFVKGLATEEKAAKTIKAVDDLSAKRKKRNTLIGNALLEERRTAMQEATDQSGMARGRTAMRANRTKTAGGTGTTSATNPYGTSNTKMPMKKRPEPNEPRIDADTQAQIQAWTSGRAEDKSSLLETVHKLDLAELDGVRTVATEEGAKKTAAAISGLMLARQERVEKITKEWKLDDERMQKLQERTGNQPGVYPGTGARGTTPGTPGQTDQTGTRRTRRYR
jgi:ankyrin repeat protein